MKNFLPLALLFAFLAACTCLPAQTPTVLTVGSTGYPTIQSAVSTACGPGATGTWQVLIPSSATPTDTIAQAKGCVRAFITDQRTTPVATCQWSNPSYLCNFGPQPTPTPTPAATVTTAKLVQDAKMFTWQNALHNCANQVVYADALTDSRGTVWQGDGSSTGPTLYSQRYLDLFTSAVDQVCAWHGTGLVPFAKFLVPGSPNPNNIFYTGVSGFLGYDGTFGPAQTNPSNGATWTPTVSFSSGGNFTFTTTAITKSVDTVRMMCVTGASMGTWTASINATSGTPLTSLTCGGGSGSKAASYVASASFTAQQVNVVTSCGGGAACEMLGLEASVGAVGFELNPFPAASAAASLYTSTTGFAYIDAMPPVHLLITDFGTNDGNLGYTPSQYGAALNTIAAHFKAQSTSPSVLITFPPVSNNGMSAATYATFAATGNAAAVAEGAAWSNVEDYWGTVFLPSLFGSDGIHPNTQGSQLEYDLLAGMAIDLASLAPMTGASGGSSTPAWGTPNITTNSAANVVFPNGWLKSDVGFTLLMQPASTLAPNTQLAVITFGKQPIDQSGTPIHPPCVVQGIVNASNYPLKISQVADGPPAGKYIAISTGDNTTIPANTSGLIYTVGCFLVNEQ